MKRSLSGAKQMSSAAAAAASSSSSSSGKDYRLEIIEQLKVIAEDHKARNDTFRARAYNQVLS